MSRPGGAVPVRAARNASRPRATVPGTKPPGIRAREGHLQSATHSPVTYGPYVTQNRKEGPHMSTKSALRADLDAEDRKTQAEDRKPPSRDTANSATSPIRSSASPSCRSAASRTGVPSSSVTRSPGLSPARSAADCGSTWRATAPGGRTLFGRWFPGALRIRSRVLLRLPGRALGFLARRFLLVSIGTRVTKGIASKFLVLTVDARDRGTRLWSD